MPRATRTLLAVLAAAVACLGCSAETNVRSDVGQAEPEAGPVVATVDGEAVTQGELDAWIRDRLFESEVASKSPSEQYEFRSRALEDYLNQRVVEREAERRGVDEQAVLQEAVQALGPVTDEEVAEFFEKHRQRFRPEDTLEARGPQIRQFLERERQRQALAVLLTGADVQIELEPPRVEVAASGPSRGPESAPVTIVEFSDYQCPFCSRAEPVVKEVLQRYPEQVRLVFRHLPLDSIHPRARPAAVAAICAERQDKFWEYHDLLFQNQRALGEEQLRQYAEQVGLDVSAFESCLEDPAVRARVEEDVRTAESLGISGTPAFFVNGIMISGAKPVEEFVRVIESELARQDQAGEAGEQGEAPADPS